MKRKKLHISILTIIILLGFLVSGASSTRANATDMTIKLKDQLIPIKTTKAESGYEDLEPLKEVLKDKRIIGIGESTLGANEFYEMKHRLVEFLVEEMGYRIFAVDAEFADIKAVNDYIFNKSGDIEEAIWAMRHIAWSPLQIAEDKYEIKFYPYLAPYTNSEVAGMLEWIKKFNDNMSNEKKVKFYGFDMELSRESMGEVLTYLHSVDKDIGEKYNRIWRELLSPNPEENQAVPKADFSFYFPEQWQLNSLSDIVFQMKELLGNNKEEYIEKTSLHEYEMAYKNIDIIIQWIKYREKSLNYQVDEAINLRYYNMAKNIEWILEHERSLGNDKIIVLAHNRQITKRNSNYTTMGENLNKVFGDKYYAIGMDFYEGRFRAYGVDLWGTPVSHYLAKFNIKTSSKKTLAYQFQKTGIPSSFLDFQSVEDREFLDFLSKNQLIHDIGIMYPGKILPSKYLNNMNKRFSNEVPIEAYDGFIFIKEISETTGLKDKRDTQKESGDRAILMYYLHMFIGQIAMIVGVVIIIVYTFLYIRKKIKDKNKGKGVRYPGDR